MKNAKLFSILVALVIGLYGATGFYFLPLAGFQGDLTRIGLLPESLFGWTKQQPAIDPTLLRQSSWREADVLVIGDSFSESGIWQTALTRRSLKVHTEHWAHIGNICEDFVPWLHKQGFKGKYVVIQAIERNIGDLAHSLGCKHMNAHLSLEGRPRQAPPVKFDPSAKNYSGRISIGFKVRSNTLKYEQASSAPGFSSLISFGTRVARLQNGCDLFSHKQCKDVLFLAADSSSDWSEEVVHNMEVINARLRGVTPIWAIVPDKSTAYLHPDKQLWNRLDGKLNSADLLNMVRRAIADKTVDLYPANNTHFSTTGYLLMGEEIWRHMRNDTAGKPGAKSAGEK